MNVWAMANSPHPIGFDPNLGSSVPSGNRSICKLNTPFDGDIRTLSLTDDGLEGVPEVRDAQRHL